MRFTDPDGMWPWPSWSDVSSFASGFGSTVVNMAEGAQMHNQIIGQAVLAKDVVTSVVNGDYKGAGNQLVNATGIPALVNTVSAAANGDPKALGNVAGAVAVVAVVHKAASANATGVAEGAAKTATSLEAAVSEGVTRVRHYTSPQGLKGIKSDGAINPARGQPPGVHVEVEPFGKASTGAAQTGAASGGAYVEFDAAKSSLIPTNVGPRSTANIPTGGKTTPLPINNANPVYNKIPVWKFW